MIKLFDRVKVNIPTTGTGDITFGAAASTAFLTPIEAGVLDGDEVRYVIVDGVDFEEGVGLIKDTVATMGRTVTKSKIGGVVGTSALNLSGTAVLALTASAADILTPGDNLASLVDADAALDNLGGTTVGKAVFKAPNEAAALSALPSAYHKDNILGFVGFSAGKNTGAIIESGSNANGSYVKFADGTQICTKLDTQSSVSISISYGSDGWRSGGIPWTYPSAFADTPAALVLPRSLSAFGAIVANQSTNPTTALDYVFVSTQSDGAATRDAVLFATGRWRA